MCRSQNNKTWNCREAGWVNSWWRLARVWLPEWPCHSTRSGHMSSPATTPWPVFHGPGTWQRVCCATWTSTSSMLVEVTEHFSTSSWMGVGILCRLICATQSIFLLNTRTLSTDSKRIYSTNPLHYDYCTMSTGIYWLHFQNCLSHKFSC